MNKHHDFVFLVREILNSSTLDELNQCSVKMVDFLKKYELSENTTEFKKLKTVVTLMKMKLKPKNKYHIEGIVGKTYTISESRFISIFS
jgi:hypothetical protein